MVFFRSAKGSDKAGFKPFAKSYKDRKNPLPIRRPLRLSDNLPITDFENEDAENLLS